MRVHWSKVSDKKHNFDSDWKTAWWFGFSHAYGHYFMRDLKYKNKTIKMDEKTWEKLKDKRRRSGLSWNLFIVELLKKNG